MSTRQRLALLAGVVVVAVATFVIAKPDDEESERPRPAQRPTTAPQATPPRPAVARVEIQGGDVVGGARKITVAKGDLARIAVSSDAPDELHLHGYDLTKRVAPGRPARFRLKADVEGEFELEAHDLGHRTIASLVVEPE